MQKLKTIFLLCIVAYGPRPPARPNVCEYIAASIWYSNCTVRSILRNMFPPPKIIGVSKEEHSTPLLSVSSVDDVVGNDDGETKSATTHVNLGCDALALSATFARYSIFYFFQFISNHHMVSRHHLPHVAISTVIFILNNEAILFSIEYFTHSYIPNNDAKISCCENIWLYAHRACTLWAHCI